MNEEMNEKLGSLFTKIAIPLIIFFLAYMQFDTTFNGSYKDFCLNRRSKISVGIFEGYYNFKSTINAEISYKFNDTLKVNVDVPIKQNEENLRCYKESQTTLYGRYISGDPYKCKGDTISIIYDSLNYRNCYIVGMSKIPKPDEFYRSLFEWYERKFVPKEKWCVCEK